MWWVVFVPSFPSTHPLEYNLKSNVVWNLFSFYILVDGEMLPSTIFGIRYNAFGKDFFLLTMYGVLLFLIFLDIGFLSGGAICNFPESVIH